ncbi:MAG: 23S rRNA (uracil(1939)-C(5))-methyltransferase RlmD [Bacteroidota bacterium]
MGRKFKQRVLENIKVTGIADKGKSVGRDQDGRVIFIENTVPGDVADVLVYKRKKGFFLGKPTAIHTYSEDRTEPFCEHFGKCGGCKWQHLDYQAQIRHKQEVVENALLRIGKIDVETIYPILGSKETTYYRNKLEFSFSNKRWLTREELVSGITNKEDVLGFHSPGSFDKIIDINHCWLQPDPSNAIRNFVRKIAIEQQLSFFDSRENVGFLRNMIVRVTSLGEILLIFSFHHNSEKKIKRFLDALLAAFPQINSLYYCINPKVNDFIMDLEMKLYSGKPYIEEQLKHVRFRIGPKSFFQTNTKQAEELYQLTADFAGLTGQENVYDLYTGIGSIALFVAKDCKQVVGIEEIEAAIDDAKVNAELNDVKNSVFYAGDVKDILTTEFAQKHAKPDVLITDPPRAGMHPKVVDMLLQLEAPKMVYVSCNPATQARDLNLLSEKYEVLKSRAVDMFPHTHHVENVALLQLKKQTP